MFGRMKKLHVLSVSNEADMKTVTSNEHLGGLQFEVNISDVRFCCGEPDDIDMSDIRVEYQDMYTPEELAPFKEYLKNNYLQIVNELLDNIEPEHYAWLDECADEERAGRMDENYGIYNSIKF